MVQFRSILVPLDGSPFAEQALPTAMDLATRAGAIVQLALVHQPLPTWATSLEVPQLDPTLDQEGRDRESAYLTRMAEQIKHDHGLPATQVILDGPVALTLAEYAESSATDLVVMTTHGRGPLSRFWLGSVADQLLRRLTVPALVLRPSEKGGLPAVPARRILVTLDRSPFAEAVLEPALALARLTAADVRVLTVVEPVLPLVEPPIGAPLVVDDEVNQKLAEAAQAYLESIAERLRKEGMRVTTSVVASPGAAHTIITETAGDGCDLVAMATHGERGLRRAVLGSVADKVIRGGTCPVLVYRPGARD